MRLVFLGPPGAGKGTQAALLAEHLGVPHISSGDIIREQKASRTALGTAASEYESRGELVPDPIVLDMIDDRLRRPDAEQGYVLDGFPRTPKQAQALDARLAQSSKRLDAAVLLSVPDEEIQARLQARRRPDDRPETIRIRLEAYRRQTAELIPYYRRRRVLWEVDGTGTVEEVAGRILATIADVRDAQQRAAGPEPRTNAVERS